MSSSESHNNIIKVEVQPPPPDNNNMMEDDATGGNGVKKYVTPDYGTAYVPNAGPEQYAPKSLDHFKRGYEERAAQRDKEFYTLRNGPTGGGGNHGNHGNGGGGGNNSHGGRGGGNGGRGGRYAEDPWVFRDRPTVLQGLDINALVDRLSSKLSNKDALFADLDRTRQDNLNVFEGGKAMTALISVAARRKNIGLGHAVWDWMDHAGISKNTFHYNSMISVTEKARDYQRALGLLKEMKERKIAKNEVTFSSAISACEKCGQWQRAIDLLNSMEEEGVARTAIAYNAAISACEKGMVPQKACEVFQRMKREGIAPSVVSYSALISAAEKGGQWKLALEILDEMKNEGFRGNVVAYSAAISALAKGQQWRKALYLFREIQSHGGTPSIVTYNATMTALEKGMQWERALDLFEEMKMLNLPITVVSYGSAISACDKGFQYRQCLEFLDEMTEMGIQKNVIIFGAAMSCMEKCSRADIGFQLMKRMKEEGIAPNVHIYNSAISACARSNLWEKGYELYEEMETFGVKRDVVTYNAVLDAVSSQIRLGRMLFEVGVERGFYAKVSRLGEQWFELDLHFLSLGGGEIALGWWFEECLVPYLTDTEKLATVKSISIVTGYGKTRTRGRRHGDDGMRKRCKAMLEFMNIKEHEQPNLGRIHVNKESLIEEVKKKGGRVIFDLDGYLHWKETETTANVIPDTEQKIRARFKPTVPGSCRPPFTRVENESTTEEYLLENQRVRLAKIRDLDALEEGDYRADIDYGLRDNIHFGQGTEDQVRRPETAMSDGGRNDRGFQRDDSRRSGGDRFGHYGPPGGSVEPQDSARRGFDEPRVHCNDEHGLRHNEQTSVVNQLRGPDDGGFDRSGLSNNGFRQEERNRGFDQARRPYDSPVVRNNAPSNFSHDIRRQDDRGRVFEQPRRQVEAPSLVNGPPNGFRQDQDIRGRGFEQPSRPVELPFNSTGAAKDFRQDDRDRGFEQARRPNEAFFDRNGPSIGGRSDDPGRYEHPRRPAEACFDRNGPPIGGRHDDRGRGFDQPGQYKSVGEATRYNDERYDGRPNDRVGGPIGHYGPASDHPMNDGPPRRDRGGIQSRVFGGPDQGDFQRNGDRDGRFPNDLPGRSPGPRMPFNPDNDRRFSEGLPPRREFEPNGFRQNNERKRPFNEEPTPRRESEFRGYPSYPNEPERRLSSRSRGYELDPQPQRTRLSSIVLEDRKRE